MGYQNFFATRLGTDIGASDNSITLETAPTKTSGRLVLEARNSTQREIIKYTGVTGTTITGVTRGEGGTSAKSHLKNALVEMNLTAEDLQELRDSFDTFTETAGDGWLPSLSSFATPSGYNKGNRSFAVETGDDLTNTLSPGMRMKFTRGTAAPTQSADFELSSSQYASKVAPVGITFTDDYTIEMWVKLESYGAGTAMNLVTRWDGTSGFLTEIDNHGRVRMYADQGANVDDFNSIEAVPLDRWTHIAITVDASANSHRIYIDGVSVAVTSVSTAATAIVQAGDLTIGARSGGTHYLDGKIVDARIWSAIRTETQIRDNMSQLLTGSEASLVAYYPFNGSWNDLTANANHLTPSGGAVVTELDNPYNDIEYAIVTGVDFAAVTTITLQTSSDGLIPNMALTSPAYSTQKTPYGFPSAKTKWCLFSQYRYDTITGSTSGVWYNGGVQLTLPRGEWEVDYFGNHYTDSGTSASAHHHVTLSTSSTAEDNASYTSYQRSGVLAGTLHYVTEHVRDFDLSVSSPTVYYLLLKSTGATGNQRWTISFFSPTHIRAYCAYL